jgi:hypothetical protein
MDTPTTETGAVDSLPVATDTTPTTEQTQSESVGNATTDAPQAESAEGASTPDYADFQLPEDVQMDQQLFGEFTKTAKAIGLNQDQAQQLINMGAQLSQKIMAQAQEDQIQRVNAWADETRNDKEIGGDQLQQNLATAKKAMDAFGSDELIAVLDSTGLGNHPAIIKAFVKAGKAVSEDTLMPGGAQVPTAQKSLAQTLYPNMNP